MRRGRKALNFDRISLPRIRVGHLGSFRKERPKGVPDEVPFIGGGVKGLAIRPSTPTVET